MFRLPYRHKISDFVPARLRDPETLDLAEAIFGTVDRKPAIKGRVFFEDALWQRGDQDHPFLDAGDRGLRSPEILSGPKPTSFQHYLAQPAPDDKKTLKHWASDPKRDGNPRPQALLAQAADRPGGAIRGRGEARHPAHHHPSGQEGHALHRPRALREPERPGAGRASHGPRPARHQAPPRGHGQAPRHGQHPDRGRPPPRRPRPALRTPGDRRWRVETGEIDTGQAQTVPPGAGAPSRRRSSNTPSPPGRSRRSRQLCGRSRASPSWARCWSGTGRRRRRRPAIAPRIARRRSRASGRSGPFSRTRTASSIRRNPEVPLRRRSAGEQGPTRQSRPPPQKEDPVKPGDQVQVVVLEEKTKKGGWKFQVQGQRDQGRAPPSEPRAARPRAGQGAPSPGQDRRSHPSARWTEGRVGGMPSGPRFR